MPQGFAWSPMPLHGWTEARKHTDRMLTHLGGEKKQDVEKEGED